MNLLEVSKIVTEHSLDNLRSVPFVEGLVKQAGLHNDDRVVSHYGVEERFIRSEGMLQQPRQLAEALVFLSDKKIETYIEIGTFYGTGTVFIASYLSKFNPGMKTTTVDNSKGIDPFILNSLKESGVHIEQIIGTSDDLKGLTSDLCFIDADHTYDWVVRDFDNVGKFAKICMFHDIIDEWVADDLGQPGSIKHWPELKLAYPDKQFHEFTYHPDNKKYFGIGVML